MIMAKYVTFFVILLMSFPAVAQVYINEVDYDQPGTDATEFIELVGPVNTPLDGYIIELVNGNGGAVYNSLSLTGATIPNDNVGGYGFFVIGPSSGVVNVDTVPPGWTTNQIQNGPPDGILLKYNGVVVDGFSYEGVLMGNPDFTPGMAISAVDVGSDSSIGRVTLGFDPNDQDQYFAPTVAPPSPGEQNTAHGQDLTGNPPPNIQNILSLPFPANQNFDITCEATIASGTIDSVYLYFYTDFNIAGTDSIQMVTPGGNQYSGNISSLANQTSLIYWVRAWGNSLTSTSSLRKVLIGIPDISLFHTQSDTSGLPLHRNHLTRLRGIVTVSTAVFSITNYDFYMQDNTGGINVFDFDFTMDSTQYFQGDSLEVVGMIDVYNGKVEIVDFSATVLSSGNPLPDPINVNIEDMGEEYEGRLISIDNVSRVSGTWYVTPPDTSFNITVNDGSGDLVLRVVGTTDIGGNPEPQWPVTVTGLGNQFDISAPYFEGYQIQPRSYADFLSTGLGDPPSVIQQYRLEQNYPNPFNPRTLIRYELKQAGDVEFQVFNILGQQVFASKLAQAAGSHERVFDGSQLSSGIYFYQLKSGEFHALRKMILTR